MAAVCAAYRATTTTDKAFAPVTDDASRAASQRGTDRNPLATQLNTVAKCVKMGVRTRVYMVRLGGFDHARR
jgi:hypothetical protein